MTRRENPNSASRPAWRVALFAAAAWLALGASPSLAAEPADGSGVVPEAAPLDSAATTTEAAPLDGAAMPMSPPAAVATPPKGELNAPLASTRRVRLRGHSDNVVRSGPGESFAIVGVYPDGVSFPVLAKNGDWYGVRLSDSETGWVHASLCQEFDDLGDLEFKPNPKRFTRTGSYIMTGYGGAYAFDRKSNSLVLGGRLGYYVFDRVQVEGGVAWTHVHRPAEIVESLFGLSLEAEDYDMLFYHLILTYEILPGRQMVPFVSGGLGSSIMLGESEPSLNIGAGTTLFLSKRTAMRWEFRHYRFTSGSEGARIANNNIEFVLGTAVLF